MKAKKSAMKKGKFAMKNFGYLGFNGLGLSK